MRDPSCWRVYHEKPAPGYFRTLLELNGNYVAKVIVDISGLFVRDEFFDSEFVYSHAIVVYDGEEV